MSWSKVTTEGKRLNVAVLGVFALAGLTFSLPSPAAVTGSPASPYYAFDVIEQGGSLGQGPSINNRGHVAFTSHTPGPGDGIYFWDATSSGGAKNINPSFTNNGRRFNESAQLNDGDSVVAQDQVPGSPPSNFIRIWDATATDSPVRIARGGAFNPDYDAVFSNPTMNNTAQVGFLALSGSDTILVTPNASGSGFNESEGMQGPLRPQMDDNGNIVVRAGNQTDSPIKLFDYALGSPTVIAETTPGFFGGAPMFSAVGRSPGISDDGTVIAFYGDLTPAGADKLKAGGYTTNPGLGIFASIDDGSGARKIVRITGWQVEDNASDQLANIGNQDGVCNHAWVADTGEICAAAPELGWSEGSTPGAPFSNTNLPVAVGFSSYDVDTRVAVTHTDLGPAGIVGDTYTVAFGATPDGQDRVNPATGQPLGFTAQKGIWTVSTTVAIEINGAHKAVYNSNSPLKVAQVGDVIGGQAITDLTLNDALGQGKRGPNGAVRTVRPGDHQIVFWASTSGGDMIVRGTHFDSDEDGLTDDWETNGIDINGDGVVDLNLPAMGASPTKRDVFLELDWLANRTAGVTPAYSYQPAPGVTAALAAMFAAAPALPDGVQAGITAHIDAGPGVDATPAPMIQGTLSQNMPPGPIPGAGGVPLQGGNTITGAGGTPIDVILNSPPGAVSPVAGLNAVAFQTLKDQYFAGAAGGPAVADLGARELAFHYAIFGGYYDPWMANGAVYTDTVVAGSNNAAGTIGQLTMANAWPSAGGSSPGTVEVLTGVGAGQIRVVSSFTTNKRPNVTPAWVTPPQAGDQLAFMIGSSGVAESGWQPHPDLNPHPGNDLMVTLAGFGINASGWLADQCVQWRTLAHELGHTLGLRHGGIDHFQYKGGDNVAGIGPVPAPGAIDSAGTLYAGPPYDSLMSYSWQLDCPSQGSPGGAAVSNVQSYAGATDQVFDDWAHVRLDFQASSVHLGSSLWHDSYDGAVADSVNALKQDNDTYNILSYRRDHGGHDPDLAPPTAALTGPRDGKQYAVGDVVTTTFTALDDVGIDRVTASLDVNGDGTIDANETVTAVAGPNNTYTAAFPALSGPQGTRRLVVTAYDLSGGAGGASRTIKVGAVADNDPPDVIFSPPAHVAEGSTTDLSASATDPEGDPVTYSWSATGAAISGSTSTASLTAGDGPATASMTVTVTDNHGHATAVTRAVTIDNVAPSATFANDGPVPEGSDFHVSLSSPTDPSAADRAAGFTYAFDCGNGYGGFASSASASCATSDNGTVSVGAKIRDRDGGAREYRSTVTVTNVPPVATGGGARTQVWGLPVSFVGAAADPSSVDQAAGFASSWSFGDGQSAPSASAMHAYAKPGSYSARFSATDKDGGTGTATVAVTIAKRGGAVAYTGATSAPFGFLTLQARLSDSVDQGSAQLGGHSVLFVLGSQSYVATTNAAGVASVTPSPVAPGSYPLAVSLANDAYYNVAAIRSTVTVTRSLGSVAGSGLQFVGGATGSLSLSSSSAGVTGTLSYSSPSLSLTATSLGPVGIRSDGHAAWLNGVDSAGRKLVIYAEDNGPGGAGDVFRLWVNGALVSGNLTGGDITISNT